MAPDFLNGYYLTNEEVFSIHKTEVGLILQNYYEQLGEAISPSEEYLLSKVSKVSIGDLSRTNKNAIDVTEEGLSTEYLQS